MSTIENKRRAAIEILRQAGYSMEDAIEVTQLREPIGLRDQFAMAAMQLVYPGKTHEGDSVFANRAYELADAMMNARKHGQV